jgi:hypothetical protein
MVFATSSELIAKFCTEHVDGHREVIVEAAYRRHVAASCQWRLTSKGAIPMYASAQMIAPDGLTHMGNVVASDDRLLPILTAHDVAMLYRLARPFADYWCRAGYRGLIGFDFIGVRHGVGRRWYIVETNGRVSASQYATSVGEQVGARTHRPWAVAMSNIGPAPGVAENFEDLAKVFGELLFDGTTGALPFLVRLLPDKAAVMCVAEDVRGAEQLLAAVRERVQCRMSGG